MDESGCNGGQDDFLRLFMSHRDSLYAYIRILVPEPEAAEDILQDASIVLWQKFDTFEKGTSFSAWARKVILNIARNEHRKRIKFPVLVSPRVSEALAESFDRLEDMGSDREWRTALEKCMARLAPRAREVVEMRYFDRMGLSEIGEALGRTAAGVNSALHKARLFLETCITRNMRKSELS